MRFASDFSAHCDQLPQIMFMLKGSKGGVILMKSCVMTRLSLSARLNEAKNLHLNHTRNVKQNVAGFITQARETEEKLSQLLGRSITNLKTEIGPGQQLVQMSYFGTHDEVVGIDFDLVPQGVSLVQPSCRARCFVSAIPQPRQALWHA
jgi:hypothetical protein